MSEKEPNLAGFDVSFGPFRIVLARRALLCGHRRIPLSEPSYNLLLLLLEEAGHVVGRDKIVARVWGTPHVAEVNIRSAVAALRRAFRDAGAGRPYISTVATRGYRFDEPVRMSERMGQGDGLPAQLAPLIGREAIIAELQEDISCYRYISVLGPGGVGKTSAVIGAARLALRDHRIDSVDFVALDEKQDRGYLAEAVRSALDVPSARHHAEEDIWAYLGSRRALIILDSCEAHAHAAVGLIDRVLTKAPNAVFLATSRIPLPARGGRVRYIDPLPLPPPGADDLAMSSFAAVELFVSRARACRSDFVLNEANARLVADICRRLDGMPLSIEMAAACIDNVSLPLLARLADGAFCLEIKGRHTARPRHRSLSANLQWNFELLTAQERLLLLRLTIFKDPFSFESACYTVGEGALSPGDVAPLLESLISKSMVVPCLDVEGFFRLHNTMRIYAHGKFRESRDYEAIARRHAAYCRHMLRVESERLHRTGINYIGYSACNAEVNRIIGQSILESDPFKDIIDFGFGWLSGRIHELHRNGSPLSLTAVVAEYLSVRHRDDPVGGCQIGALLSDVGRTDPATKVIWTQGIRQDIEAIAYVLDNHLPPGDHMQEAIFLYSAMVGAIGLSRAVSDECLSSNILDSVAAFLVGQPSAAPSIPVMEKDFRQRASA